MEPGQIAAITPGFSGADLANLVNEAALLATRRGANAVGQEDFTSAIERIVAGLEKKNRVISVKERRTVAYHEMGHALVATGIPGSDPIHKISIIPRGIGALGYTMQRPTEDRFLMSRSELEDKLAVLLGGRAAEHIAIGEYSTGAADDLAKATEIARSMATRYGMEPNLGPVTYVSEAPNMLGGHPSREVRPVSEETAREIDVSVKAILVEAFERAVSILTDRRALLEHGAAELLSKETLTSEELGAILASQSNSASPEAHTQS
jgi:cell division protease FtsH